MSKISVVMPVHNSQNFLEKAIESVLNQTYKNLELILVNDSSKDLSGEICENMKKKDNRIRVIHLEHNVGLSKARNIGINYATGDYIAFCDHDDLFEPYLLENNYRLAKKYNADMVKFSRKLVDVSTSGEVLRTKVSPIKKVKVYENEDLLTKFFEIRSLNILINVWDGLYKTEIIKKYNLKFDESMKYGSEDADFSLRYYMHSSKIVVNPDICYIHFRRNSTSTSRKFSLNKVNSIIKTIGTESEIWGKLDNTLGNRLSIIFTINNYIINILQIQLFHKDCNLKLNDKISIISRIRELPQCSYELDTNVWKILIKKPKQALFSYLYIKKSYKTLLILMKVYSILFGEKWR